MINIYTLFFLLISFQTLHAQNKNFEKDWRTIDSLEINGLVRDALKKTDAILITAERKKDYNNYIKAQLFRWKFVQIVQENPNTTIINEVNQCITKIPFPYNAILQAYKAQFLRTYYEENQWQIFERRAIENPDKNDLETWSLDYLLSEIRASYHNALKHEKELIEIAVQDHALLIDAMPLTREYRSTLYDLIAYGALEFFETDFNYVTRPEEVFSPSAEDLFAPSSAFQKLKFNSPDSLYSKINVLRMYQNLEHLHAPDKDPAAFVFAQLNRLDFANGFLNTDTAWELYMEQLNMLVVVYKKDNINGLIKYHIALAYRTRAADMGLR